MFEKYQASRAVNRDKAIVFLSVELGQVKAGHVEKAGAVVFEGADSNACFQWWIVAVETANCSAKAR